MTLFYFVSVYGEIVASNLTRDRALSRAYEEYDNYKSTLVIGIGRVFLRKGEKRHASVPMHFYTESFSTIEL